MVYKYLANSEETINVRIFHRSLQFLQFFNIVVRQWRLCFQVKEKKNSLEFLYEFQIIRDSEFSEELESMK